MVQAVAVALGAHELEDTELQKQLVSHLLKDGDTKNQLSSWSLSVPEATVTGSVKDEGRRAYSAKTCPAAPRTDITDFSLPGKDTHLCLNLKNF